MNIHEGARRMKRTGQWLIMIPLTVTLILWGIAMARSVALGLGSQFWGAGAFVPLIGFVYLAVPGGLLWLASWIVEGFAEKEL